MIHPLAFDRSRWAVLAALSLCLLISRHAAALQEDSPAKGILQGPGGEVPSKSLELHNNSDRPLYFILQTSINPIDEWLQAYHAVPVSEEKMYSYGHTRLYRIYVNGSKGIPRGGVAKVKVPFFSKLVATPTGTRPDEFINWWNGMRVYVYDNQPDLLKAYNQDLSNRITPLTEGPTCVDNSCDGLEIYAGNAGLSEAVRSQLAEYTFGSAIKQPSRWFMDYSNVDYDISYVDHVYLPIAMGPLGNRYIGYSGSTKRVPDFKRILHDFIAPKALGEGWPRYILADSDNNDLKLPGAYNALALVPGQDITPAGRAIEVMKQLWRPCFEQPTGDECDPRMKQVKSFFDSNYARYQDEYSSCQPRVTNTFPEMLKHIYGWVPFNEGCNNAAANALKDTKEYFKTHAVYRELQYDPSGRFNPYVKLIHGPNLLGMSAYAFSIDDAVGNMQELGDGLAIAVGGAEGLPNREAYEPGKSLIVTLGHKPDAGPIWASYGVCKPGENDGAPDMELPNNVWAFKLGTISYPARVMMKDVKGNVYRFTLAKTPPLTTNDISDCTVNNQPTDWCRQFNPNTQQDNLTGRNVYYLSLPEPPQ